MSHSTKRGFKVGACFEDPLPGVAVIGTGRPRQGRSPTAAPARDGRQVSRCVPDICPLTRVPSVASGVGQVSNFTRLGSVGWPLPCAPLPRLSRASGVGHCRTARSVKLVPGCAFASGPFARLPLEHASFAVAVGQSVVAQVPRLGVPVLGRLLFTPFCELP